jgi:hypothetical protein
MKPKILSDRNVLQMMALSWQLLQAVAESMVPSYEINGNCSVNEDRHKEVVTY